MTKRQKTTSISSRSDKKRRDAIEQFADDTLIFTKRLLAHLTSKMGSDAATDDVLTSVIAILMQSDNLLTNYVRSGLVKIQVAKSEPPANLEADQRGDYSAICIKIVCRNHPEQREASPSVSKEER